MDRMFTKKRYKALIVGRVYIDGQGDKEMELLGQLDNDPIGTGIFDDVEQVLLPEVGVMEGEKERVFSVYVEAKFDTGWDIEDVDIVYGKIELLTDDRLTEMLMDGF